MLAWAPLGLRHVPTSPLLMVAQLSPPCGFLVLILSGAVDSTLETFKVLQLPEQTGHLRYTALDPPLGVYMNHWHRTDWHSHMLSNILGMFMGANAACLPCSRFSSAPTPSFLLLPFFAYPQVPFSQEYQFLVSFLVTLFLRTRLASETVSVSSLSLSPTT